ncbi:DNA-binding protein [Halomicroarcula sp. GCM10025817]|uniref:DNA-binding protein n=1 Tax=Haloarcula TaxID=2237 RepID=UPI0023E8D10B|nr:DNA-binding protein [Halomicroarcula sp. SYNS111]
MSIENALRYEDSHDEQAVEEAVSVEETPELRRSVEQEIQGNVDTNHYEAAGRGLTLEAEERLAARDWEISRTRNRWDYRADSDREARTRADVERTNEARRRRFAKRAASVDPWAGAAKDDPRSDLSRDELATVNRQAKRIHDRVRTGTTTAALSKRLARRLADGADILEASVSVTEAEWNAPGTVVPIGALGDVNRSEVCLEGHVTVLWEPTSPAISQVGLIEDETGRTKFTSWAKSDMKMVREGEWVRLRGVEKSWYEGRVSVALTGWSRIEFPERERL